MDANDILKQGKEFADKLRHGAGEQVAQNERKIKDTIGKVVGFVNTKTEGKYAEQVKKAASFVEQGVDRLAAEAPPRSGAAPSEATRTGTAETRAEDARPSGASGPSDPVQAAEPPGPARTGQPPKPSGTTAEPAKSAEAGEPSKPTGSTKPSGTTKPSESS